VEIPQLDHGGEGSRSQRYLEFGIGDKWLGDGEFGQQLLQNVLCWCVAWTSAEPTLEFKDFVAKIWVSQLTS
jgi:hypothetical protein